jgi:hypothetical protein
MVIKYSNISHFKALQNLPKFAIFGLKINHLATLNGGRMNFLSSNCSKKPNFFDQSVPCPAQIMEAMAGSRKLMSASNSAFKSMLSTRSR